MAHHRGMTAGSERMAYSVEMLISDWVYVDATMDNHIQSAIDGSAPGCPGGDADEGDVGWEDPSAGATAVELGSTGLPPLAQLGIGVRRAGWDQISGWPRDLDGLRTWPAPGQTATLTLDAAQWGLVIFALRHWAQVDERMSDFEEAARSRALATVLEDRLGAIAQPRTGHGP